MVTNFNPASGVTKPKEYVEIKAPQETSEEIKQREQIRAEARQQQIQAKMFSRAEKGISAEKSKQVSKAFSGAGKIGTKFLGKGIVSAFAGRKRTGTTLKDQMKIIRFRNRLEKERLKNAIERFKIQRRVMTLQKQGKLGVAQQIMAQGYAPQMPMQISQLNYPAYADQVMRNDIDSGFYADSGYGDNLFGNEAYFNEDYYSENYFSGEDFEKDPVLQLGLKIANGVSPLLY